MRWKGPEISASTFCVPPPLGPIEQALYPVLRSPPGCVQTPPSQEVSALLVLASLTVMLT